LAFLSQAWLVCSSDAQENAPIVLSFEQSQTAGMDGREWDKSFPGTMTMDAVHRTVLLRFPHTAEAIKAQLDAGFSIDKVEVVLKYDDTEILPSGYDSQMGQQKWRENPPQWHVVAWALRRPWIANRERGPTFNAYLNGCGYWARYGASDTDRDRFFARFGPSELSHLVSEGRLDVTAVLNDPAFGAELGKRLRLIEENGFLLKKLETYDIRYASPSDYEWAVSTGGHGLRFKNPRLVVTFRRPAAQHSDSILPLTLPKSTDLSSLATSL